MSFLRKQDSTVPLVENWIPAFAGMTAKVVACHIIIKNREPQGLDVIRRVSHRPQNPSQTRSRGLENMERSRAHHLLFTIGMMSRMVMHPSSSRS